MKPKAAIIRRIGVSFRLQPGCPQGTGPRCIPFGYLPKRPFSTPPKTHGNQVLVWSEMKGELCPEKEEHAEAVEGGGYEDFFRYTSGRWIYNEDQRLREVYKRFNVDELKRKAAACLGHGSCVSVSKLAEGGASKIFLLSMEDGFEAIAKIPTPIAGPSYYLTASEVATMDFLRTELSLPVPVVYDWNASTSNPVGAEYIIMEKVNGIELSKCWGNLTGKETLEVFKQLCEFENKLFTTSFSHSGSIYYRDSLPPEQQAITLSSRGKGYRRWCIGPTADPSFWYDERAELDIDRGPWKTTLDYVLAVSARERPWIRNYARPQCMPRIFSKSTQQIHPSVHLDLLDDYDKLMQHLIQPGDSGPVLRHPDLRLGNIFVSPETKKIVSLIDWQGAKMLPASLHAGYPNLASNDGHGLTQSLKAPTKPNYDELGEGNKQEAHHRYIQERACHLYTIATAKWNYTHFRALREPFNPIKVNLVRQAGYAWNGNMIPLRTAIIRAVEVWHEMTGGQSSTCPVKFDENALAQYKSEIDEYNTVCDELESLRSLLAVDQQGWISNELFEEARKENRRLREEFASEADPDERKEFWAAWPFKDDSDTSEWKEPK